jgi:hypothetical protein
MTKTEYGVPVPRGVRKDWTAYNRSARGEPFTLRGYGVPLEWGDPTICVVWRDRFGRARLCVGHYANGRSATIRTDANGRQKTTFGEVE